MRGGDSGPALIPGDPDKSLLIEAVRYTNPDLEMPPKQKLSEREIRVLEKWVAMSAPDPRVAEDPEQDATADRKPGVDPEQVRSFWSYQPPVKWSVPAVNDSGWPHNAIDRFLLAQLETRGMTPMPDADRAVLARRLSFDLTGLPPTPEQIDAFVLDESPAATMNLVDRLLASPQFGERWGRHWLDVARFAESVTLRGLIFKNAWRYRDYVVDAFNHDLPYDQFVREQIAGDLLPSRTLEESRQRLIATGFLVFGNINLEEQDKKQLDMNVVDEQLDVVGKTILAQTITCARCHDHKFDPIPTRDYYALAGILRGATSMVHSNVSGWVERPLPLEPDQELAYAELDRRLAALREELAIAEKRAATFTKTSGDVAVTSVESLAGVVIDERDPDRVRITGSWTRSQSVRAYIGDGYVHDANEGKGAKSVTFLPTLKQAGVYEVRLAYTASTNRATNTPVTVRHADGTQQIEIDQRIAPPIDGHFVSLGRFRFEVGDEGVVRVETQGTDGTVIVDAVQFLSSSDLAARNAEDNRADGGTRDAAAIALKFDQAKAEVERLKKKLEGARRSLPERPMAMSLTETEPVDLPIHIRGSVHNLGGIAPRGFLQAAFRGEGPEMPSAESGRRELADWLSSEANPLTARVMVNRTWHWLFGAGLVRTPDNFGSRGERPSHPKLLDWLSVRFMEEGWSVKWLVREMVLTRAYQLSTASGDTGRTEDPNNRLLWRMNRKRLEAECIRDAMLHIAGELQWTGGGVTFPDSISADYGFEFDQPVRSLYVPIFRNALPELFEVFDFANPSLVTGRRNVSTVAPQALYMMNHPFPREQAEHAARRLLSHSDLDDDARVKRIYRAALGRFPSARELEMARDYVRPGEAGDLDGRWTELIHALFGSMDFRYLN